MIQSVRLSVSRNTKDPVIIMTFKRRSLTTCSATIKSIRTETTYNTTPIRCFRFTLIIVRPQKSTLFAIYISLVEDTVFSGTLLPSEI